MVPNEGNSSMAYVSESVLFDSTKVEDHQAENPNHEAALGKKRKMIVVKGFSMPPTPFPEQGSFHLQRKKEILAKYPQIKELYGRNPWTFLIALASTSIQTYIAASLSNSSWYTIVLAAYTVGAYFNWVCMASGHEGAHGLVFGNKSLSKISTFVSFAPTFMGPFGLYWYYEHMFHHQVVVDKMNRFGQQTNPLLKKILGSLLFVAVVNVVFLITSLIVGLIVVKNAVLYYLGLRKELYQSYPKFLRPYDGFPQVANTPWYIAAIATQLLYNGSLYYYFGWAPIIYLFLSNSFCNGLHPLGMRNVSEHYMQRKNQPTNSVYSPFSIFLLNLGYHNEHHDFACIPWNRLPKIRAIAKEYYNDLFYFNSFTEVMVDFLKNPGIPLSVLVEEYNGVTHIKTS